MYAWSLLKTMERWRPVIALMDSRFSGMHRVTTAVVRMRSCVVCMFSSPEWVMGVEPPLALIVVEGRCRFEVELRG